MRAPETGHWRRLLRAAITALSMEGGESPGAGMREGGHLQGRVTMFPGYVYLGGEVWGPKHSPGN